VRTRTFACCAALALSLAGSSAGRAGAQDPRAPVQRAPVDSAAAYGARLYRVYCQSCHGEHGRGDGPVARELELSLPDLRRITKRAADGVFPTERVAAVIDGREPVAGHGTHDMPVWGLTFRDPGRVADQESDVEERVRSLVAFLRSIQETSAAGR
jgi:mono/diheme cytochrome c family protein